jgi:hypothetical protein
LGQGRPDYLSAEIRVCLRLIPLLLAVSEFEIESNENTITTFFFRDLISISSLCPDFALISSEFYILAKTTWFYLVPTCCQLGAGIPVQ